MQVLGRYAIGQENRVALLLYGLALWARGERRLVAVIRDQVILNGFGVGEPAAISRG